MRGEWLRVVCSGLRVRDFAVIGSGFRGLVFWVPRWLLRVLTVCSFRSVGVRGSGFSQCAGSRFRVQR